MPGARALGRRGQYAFARLFRRRGFLLVRPCFAGNGSDASLASLVPAAHLRSLSEIPGGSYTTLAAAYCPCIFACGVILPSCGSLASGISPRGFVLTALLCLFAVCLGNPGQLLHNARGSILSPHICACGVILPSLRWSLAPGISPHGFLKIATPCYNRLKEALTS